mgnify:FL=1
MRFIKTELKSNGKSYRSTKTSGVNANILWIYLSKAGLDSEWLLKMIERSDLYGGFGIYYLFAVEPNVYIGCDYDGLGRQQRIVLKDDPRYVCRTTKQGFIDLIKQWVKVHEQRPPGISVEEVSTDVWKVKPMTQEDVDLVSKIQRRVKNKLMMRFTKIEWCGSRDKGYYWSLKDSDTSISDLSGYLSKAGSDPEWLLKMIERSDLYGGCGIYYLFVVEPNVYMGCDYDGLGRQQRIVLKDDPRYVFRTTKKGFIDLIKQWVKGHEQRPPGISVEEVSTDVWKVRPMTQEDVERCKLSR